jgi:hypothetical protein
MIFLYLFETCAGRGTALKSLWNCSGNSRFTKPAATAAR